MLHLANSHESGSGYFVQRHLGVSLKAAQRMLRRIRLHLASLDDLPTCNSGQVHIRLEPIRGAWDPTRRSLNRANVLLFGDGQNVDFVVVDLGRPYRLRGILQRKVAAGVSIVTNCYRTSRVVHDYGKTSSPEIQFCPINSREETDTIQSFLTYFRRGLRLQHQNVHITSLWLYMAEYRFRYNRRWRSETTFQDMVSAFPSLGAAHVSGLARRHCDLA